MSTRVVSQKGFSVIEGLLILVVIGILGFTGWYVYHAKQISDKNYSTTANSMVPTYKKKTSTVATVDPYAGWKQNCSNVGNVCFKYPVDWAPTTTGSSDPDPTVTGLSLKSPTGQVEVAYNPELQGLGGACQPGICSIDVLSITTLPGSNNSNLRVLKTVFMDSEDSSFAPMYCVAGTHYLSYLHLKQGKQDIGLVYFTFTNPKSDHIESMCVDAPSAVVSTFKSEGDATTWLSNNEVTTAGKILNSIELQ